MLVASDVLRDIAVHILGPIRTKARQLRQHLLAKSPVPNGRRRGWVLEDGGCALGCFPPLPQRTDHGVSPGAVAASAANGIPRAEQVCLLRGFRWVGDESDERASVCNCSLNFFTSAVVWSLMLFSASLTSFLVASPSSRTAAAASSVAASSRPNLEFCWRLLPAS